jgi:hypothetical protein
MASAAALPGQAMYPLKLAIEQLRLASVQWSPAREACERIQAADERLEELDQLVELRMDTQIPVAVRAVDRAVMAATRAVQEARMDGADVTKVADELQTVKQEQQAQLATLFQRLPTTPASIRKAIATAVQQSKAPSQQGTPSLNTTAPTSTAAPGPVPAGSPSTTTLGAATTTQPTTTTTEPTTTTSEPTTTVAPENTTGSLEQQGQNEQAPPSSAGP